LLWIQNDKIIGKETVKKSTSPARPFLPPALKKQMMLLFKSLPKRSNKK